jgi:hypothetical protein
MKYEPRDVNLVKQNEGADNNIVDEKGTSTATAKQPQLVQTRLEISYITGPRLWLVEYA